MVKFVAIAFIAVPCLCAGASGLPFELPAGTVVINRDDSGKTWNLNGMITNRMGSARISLTNGIAKAGWKLKHDILLDKSAETVLSLWTRSAKELTVMTWIDRKNGRFHFSYGVTGND